MHILKEITDKTVGLGDSDKLGTEYELRKSARVILKNADGLIAIQQLQNHNFHKLPGGGIEEGESIEEGLRREVHEEVGCEIEIADSVGMVIEYRNTYKLLHISYCFAATVTGSINEPHLEAAEIAEGMVTVWVTPEEALKNMRSDVPSRYESHFILQREMAFLEEYLKRTQNT